MPIPPVNTIILLQNHILFLSLLNPAFHRRIFFQLARTAKTIFPRVTVLGSGSEEKTYWEDGIQVIQKKSFTDSRLTVLLDNGSGIGKLRN